MQFLSQINLDIAFLTLTVLTLLLIVWIAILHLKIRRLLKGANGASLEGLIVSTQDQIAELQKFEEESLNYFSDIERRIGRSIQVVETNRFNPFKGTGEGGNQSFATILVSEKGDGVIVSSLYSRDRVSVFSKPLAKFQSEFELTEEESAVIETAKEKLQKKSVEK